MKLRDYIFENGITIAEFAEKIDYSVHFLYRVMAGGSKPGKKLINKIQKITKGQVTWEDMEKEFSKAAEKRIKSKRKKLKNLKKEESLMSDNL